MHWGGLFLIVSESSCYLLLSSIHTLRNVSSIQALLKLIYLNLFHKNKIADQRLGIIVS